MTIGIGSILRGWESQQTFHCAGQISGNVAPLEPTYLFCESRLRERAARLLTGFGGTVSYAVKANPEPRVLQTLASAGVTNFDVASIEEICTVLNHCPTATLHYNNPVKPLEAIERAYREHAVRSFALDEMSELHKIRKATGDDTSVMYTVRFKLPHNGAAYDFGSKFGATSDSAVALLQTIEAAGARAALTFHPGSQCTDPVMYRRYLKEAANICKRAGVTPQLINVGGGFPEHYVGTKLPSLEQYFREINESAAHYFHQPVPLMCEPGRGLVAPAVSLLLRVIHVRDCGRRVFLNDGVYGGMQEQSIVDLRFPTRVWRAGELLDGNDADYQLFGPTCDPVDRFSRPVQLPAGLREGDYIEFGLLGAYGSATATRFNGFESSVYLDIQQGTDFS
jgi:ornithine decarboxylase